MREYKTEVINFLKKDNKLLKQQVEALKRVIKSQDTIEQKQFRVIKLLEQQIRRYKEVI